MRSSIRTLRRNPAFATIAILTIGLGILPLTAVVGLANGLFFRPAPGATGADRLVQVEFITRDATGDTDRARLSYAYHADLMQRVTGLTGLAGRFGSSVSIAVSGADARYVDVDFVTHDYFNVLGIRMAAGRAFAPDEDRPPSGTPVVILESALAGTLFGDPAIATGRSVLVNGLSFTVIGVTPPEFRGLKNDTYTQVWLTGATADYARHIPGDQWDRTSRRGVYEEFVGRLAPNVDLEQARTELTAVAGALPAVAPADNLHLQMANVRMERQAGMSFSSRNTRNEVALMVTLFAFAGALLLLLAGANVGNLLLFRGARRRDEMLLRSALGASPGRLLREHLTEVSMISLSGGAVGLVLTVWLAQLLQGTVIPEAGFLVLPIDWQVAGVVLACSVLAGLVFGGASAVFRWSAAGALQRAGHSGRRRLRNGLTVMQLAISLSLLVSAMLLLATIQNLVKVDLGFDPTRIASATTRPLENGYDEARSLVYYRELLGRTAAMPAVSAVAISQEPLVGRGGFVHTVQLPGDQPRPIRVSSNAVTTDYFRVLGAPLLRGRGFSQGEVFAPADSTCGPVIVSESLALRLFGTRDAVNRVVVIPRQRQQMECEVVGVAADVRANGPDSEWEPVLYRPLGRSALFNVTVLARSDGPVPLASTALREAAASIDPALPLFFGRSLTEEIEFQLAGRRIISAVLGLLAALGLLMGSVGLYGLVAETVVDRAQEFAIRIAIGAGRRSILFAVLRGALVLAGIGIGFGIFLSVGLSLAIRSQLFGVTGIAPLTYLTAAGLLAMIVVLASLAPAIRATRMNPIELLRAE